MPEQRFDIAFDGSMTANADPALARQRMQSLFKLDEAGIARLFSGKPVFIKRDVDASTAAQFEKVFSQLGAIVRLIPLDDQGEPSDPPSSDPVESAPATEPETKAAEPEAKAAEPETKAAASDTQAAEEDTTAKEPDTTPVPDVPLSLAPHPMNGFLEEPPTDKMPALDLSHLSIVSGSDWTLEDCETTPAADKTPDTSHLSLTDIEPEADTKDSGDYSSFNDHRL